MTSSKSLSVWWVAVAVMLLVFVFGAGVLVASYNEAHRPRHSDSWDGPLLEMGTCAGPVEDWMRGVREHHAIVQERGAQSASSGVGFITHFVTDVVPWHLRQHPLLPLLIIISEVGVLIGAWRIRVFEKKTA